jgi:hypothetical protein
MVECRLVLSQGLEITRQLIINTDHFRPIRNITAAEQ